MAFVAIEDTTGRTDLVVFSDVYEKSRQALHPEKLVVARGRVSTKERERPKLVAAEILALEEAYLRTPLALTLTFDVAEKPILAQALPLMEFGNWPGILNLRVIGSEESILSCSRLGGIKLSRELLENLRQFFGSEKIEIVRSWRGGTVQTASSSRVASSGYPPGNGGSTESDLPY